MYVCSMCSLIRPTSSSSVLKVDLVNANFCSIPTDASTTPSNAEESNIRRQLGRASTPGELS